MADSLKQQIHETDTQVTRAAQFKMLNRAIIALVLTCVVNILLNLYSLYDRADMRADTSRLEVLAVQNRQMLNARAFIQIALICSAERRGVFTEAEKAAIKSLYIQAEYDQAVNPPCDFLGGGE